MLPIFLHFQYYSNVACDICNKTGEGIIVLMKKQFCKECAKKIIPIYQEQLSAILKKLEE